LLNMVEQGTCLVRSYDKVHGNGSVYQWCSAGQCVLWPWCT
jgi:hypothetical protein